MDLFLFRLSLKAKEISDLFEPRADDGSELGREGWLRLYFSGEHTFNHRGSQFYYRPETETSGSRSDLILGWIGRERTVHERTPPTEGFEPTERPQWQAAFIAIDPGAHSDGQKIALEANNDIGRPHALIQSLIRHMNEMGEPPFSAQVFPIVEAGSFWTFAAAHGDQIKSITFDVAAPNMFKDLEDFQEEMRALRDNENVANVKTTLESDGTLNHKTDRLTQIVDYTERGAGTLSAEAADGSKYSSETHEKREHAEVEHHNRDPRKFLRDIAATLDRIFP